MCTIIWATGNLYNNEWEYDWIKELFIDAVSLNGSNKELIWINDIECNLNPITNAIIVFYIKSANDQTRINNYINKYEASNTYFSLIHLSDEYYNCNYNIYNSVYCKYIYRNYWHPQLNFDKIKTFALGYKIGFWNTYNKPKTEIINEEKSISWCFSGDFKDRHPDRRLSVTKFMQIKNGFFKEETGNSFSNRQTGLETSDYRSLFLKSKFALCPIGNVNLDTFRLYEALECGCIPVVTNISANQNYNPSYWTCIFKTTNIPFIIESNWDKCVERVQFLLSYPDLYKQMQHDVINFWYNYKSNLKTQLYKDLII